MRVRNLVAATAFGLGVLAAPVPADAAHVVTTFTGQVNYPTVFGTVECHYQGLSSDPVGTDGSLVMSVYPLADEGGEIDGCEIWGQRSSDHYINVRTQQFNPNTNAWVNIDNQNVWYGEEYEHGINEDGSWDVANHPNWAGRRVRVQVKACQVSVSCEAYVTAFDSTLDD